MRSKCIKHFDFVHEYLALLAWNRCILSLVCLSGHGDCTVRTTIDTLMTRGFSRLHLIWVWIYVAIITSLAAAAVRWSVKAAIAQERANAERIFAADVRSSRGASLGLGESATAAATAYRGKFRHNLYKKIAAAFTYVCMWAWAVAALGTLPNDRLWQDALSVVALSLLFAWAVRAGESGTGPLRGLLRRERPRYNAPPPGGIDTRPGPYDDAGEDVSDVVRLGVMRCCEWILAIAWVGTMRHAADVALASAVKSSFDTGLCAAWITAVVAVGGRAAFVVSRFQVSGGGGVLAGTDSGKMPYEVLLPEGATSGEVNGATPTRGTPTRAMGSHAVFRLEPGLMVAASARDMLSGAFAFTTGVALNAAAQSTWLGLSEGPMGATGSAMVYASVWSLGTVAAASYGAVCRDVATSDAAEAESEDDGFGGCCAPPAGERAKRLVTQLCDEEEKVGAFVAGFVWNTALLMWIGFDNEERYRWTLALAITMFSAAVNLYAEAEEAGGEDEGGTDEEP